MNTTASVNELGVERVDPLSRNLLGVQVGLVALAMFVTRSSVASLQAKQGLPLGTQVVGWITLGESCKLLLGHFKLYYHAAFCFQDSPPGLHNPTKHTILRYSSQATYFHTMGIFAEDAQGLEDVLELMEHPWRAFTRLMWYARIPLGAFLLLYLPFAFLCGLLMEIVWRVPLKLCFRKRQWWHMTDDYDFWYDMTYASPRRKFLMIFLQDEITCVQMDGTSESLCEKGSRSSRTSWPTKLFITWFWTKAIRVPKLMVPPRDLNVDPPSSFRNDGSHSDAHPRAPE